MGWRMHYAHESPSVQSSLHLSVYQEMVMPGEYTTTMMLMLIESVALETFQRVALREGNGTICAGVITDTLTSTDQ